VIPTTTFQIPNFSKHHFVSFVLFELDKPKDTFPVTGTMNVEIPADVSEKELKEIENVLAQSIANSLGCNPEQVKVTVDPETGIATFVVKTNDPHAAEEMQKQIKSEDFTENVNKALSENSEHLPERIRENVAVKDVNVNSLFQNNHNKTKQFQNSNFSLSKFVSNFGQQLQNWGSNILQCKTKTALPKLIE
jgi:uncharacterized radical SAM superfamily Fe-S cluster-containing enzyme